jgi:hypothetical protein
MAEPRVPAPGALVSAIMGAKGAPWNEVLSTLSEQWGAVALQGPEYPFTHSEYYQPEMGSGLVKRFFLFSRPLPQDRLAEAKLFSNKVEDMFRSPDGNRSVNIDPGLLTLHNLVLATAKGYAHRIYLMHGIYGEVTLIYQDGGFEPLPWTYPDYQMPEVLHFLADVREWLKGVLR